MLAFWIIIAIMTVIALAFVIVPLILKSKPSEPRSDQQTINVEIYKEKLRELDDGLKLGTVDQAHYSLSAMALKQQLLRDISSQTESVIKKHRHKRSLITALACFVVIPLGAYGLYKHWGDAPEVANYLAYQKNKPEIEKSVAEYKKDPQLLLRKLQAVIQENPDSAKGWFLLGRLYASLGKPNQALNAFAKANELKPNNAAIMMQYAQTRFYVNKGKLDQKSKKLIDQVLAKTPDYPSAVNLLAMNAFNQKHYQEAINQWEKLLPYFPPNSKDGEAILEAIAQANKALGRNPSEQAHTQKGQVKLTVHVAVSEKLREKLKPQDFIFVYAKAEQGPPMPLAIFKAPVAKFPMNVTLTDQMAMIPAMNLKRFEKVVVFARVSSSGKAMPEKGDLQGKSGVIEVKHQSKPINVTIDHVIG